MLKNHIIVGRRVRNIIMLVNKIDSLILKECWGIIKIVKGRVKIVLNILVMLCNYNFLIA